jgi:hypothetical protein
VDGGVPWDRVDELAAIAAREAQAAAELEEVVSRVGGAIQYEFHDLLRALEATRPEQVDEVAGPRLRALQDALLAIADRVGPELRSANEDAGYIERVLDLAARLTLHPWREDLTERREAIARLEAALALWQRDDLALPDKLADPAWRDCDLHAICGTLFWSAEPGGEPRDVPLQRLRELVRVMRAQGAGRADRAARDALFHAAERLTDAGITVR